MVLRCDHVRHERRRRIRQLREGGWGRRVGWQGQRGEVVLWRGSREPRKRRGHCRRMMREGLVQKVAPYVGIVQECRRLLHVQTMQGEGLGWFLLPRELFRFSFFSYSDFMLFYSCRDRDREEIPGWDDFLCLYIFIIHYTKSPNSF
jgi:hypothetical protein